MTIKQLAERMGVSVKQLDFELEMPCKACRRMGGTEPPCGKCEIVAIVKMKDDG
jgi:hypothetical protein